MKYRRSDKAGGTFFLTLTLADRNSDLLVYHVDLLRLSFRKVKKKYPFDLLAIVVLPDHLHMIMQLPEKDADFSTRVRLIKSGFSRGLAKTEFESASHRTKGERGIWQRRFWEHEIRDEKDFINHIDYIHYNPVKHGYVKSPADWSYSSIHKYIKQDELPDDWGSAASFDDGNFGE